MLRCLTQLYETRWSSPAARRSICNATFTDMKAFSGAASALTRLPAAEEESGRAGVTFTIRRQTEGFATTKDAARRLERRAGEIARAVSNAHAHAVMPEVAAGRQTRCTAPAARLRPGGRLPHLLAPAAQSDHPGRWPGRIAPAACLGLIALRPYRLTASPPHRLTAGVETTASSAPSQLCARWEVVLLEAAPYRRTSRPEGPVVRGGSQRIAVTAPSSAVDQ